MRPTHRGWDLIEAEVRNRATSDSGGHRSVKDAGAVAAKPIINTKRTTQGDALGEDERRYDGRRLSLDRALVSWRWAAAQRMNASAGTIRTG